MSDEYDCLTCGACCVSDFDAEDYVHVSDHEADLIRANDQRDLIYEEKTYGKPMFSMRTKRDSKGNCRCIALTGAVGEQVTCSIYDVRPTVCRKFEPGSDVCDYARQIIFGVSNK